MRSLIRIEHTIALLLFACLPIVERSASAQTVRYTVTDLGTLGGAQSFGHAINASGYVAGSSFPAGSFQQHAFIHSNGTNVDLGTLGGGYSFAYGINAAGDAVGVSSLAGPLAPGRAFLYRGGVMSDLGTLTGGASDSSHARAINNLGQIVGGSRAVSGSERAFLYSAGVMTDLGTLGGPNSRAYAINDNGVIVGESAIADGLAPMHAFIFQNGEMTDLGTLGGSHSAAYGINALGQIVGIASIDSTRRHAFLYANGSMTDLGTLGGFISQANAINSAGAIVGKSSPGGVFNLHAFIYENGVMQDLNDLIPADSEWILEEATDINDQGQITGIGTIPGDPIRLLRAFLLTPVAENTWPQYWQHATTGALRVWHMNGFQRFSAEPLNPSVESDLSWKVMAAGDFNADGQTDLIWQNIVTGYLRIWFMNGATRLAEAAIDPPFITALSWKVVATGDFNGDGHTDLLWRNDENGLNRIWIMDGTQRVSVVALNTLTDLNWLIRGAGDFNADGHTDIVWQHRTAGALAVWLMNGLAPISSVATNPPSITDLTWEIAGVRDANNNGWPDLVWRNDTSTLNRFWDMTGLERGNIVFFDSEPDLNWRIVGPR